MTNQTVNVEGVGSGSLYLEGGASREGVRVNFSSVLKDNNLPDYYFMNLNNLWENFMNYYLIPIMLITYIIIMGKMVARHTPFIMISSIRICLMEYFNLKGNKNSYFVYD